MSDARRGRKRARNNAELPVVDGGASDAPSISDEEILAAARDILYDPDTRVSARHGKYARKYPVFYDALPKLFQMCCCASSAGDVEGVLSILGVMLQQRARAGERLGQGEATPGAVVHQALCARYIDPVLQRDGSAATASSGATPDQPAQPAQPDQPAQPASASAE